MKSAKSIEGAYTAIAANMDDAAKTLKKRSVFWKAYVLDLDGGKGKRMAVVADTSWSAAGKFGVTLKYMRMHGRLAWKKSDILAAFAAEGKPVEVEK